MLKIKALLTINVQCRVVFVMHTSSCVWSVVDSVGGEVHWRGIGDSEMIRLKGQEANIVNLKDTTKSEIYNNDTIISLL